MAATAQNGRALALARRKAMSSSGKSAIAESSGSPSSTPASASPSAAAARPAKAYQPPRQSTGGGARKASRERRLAMSSKGKQAVTSADRTRTGNERAKQAAGKPELSDTKPSVAASTGDTGCGCGCGGDKAKRNKAPETSTARARTRRPKRPALAQNPSKAAALARRRAQSTRGKAGLSNGGMSEAQTARAANPQLSGRELAQALREQRSKRGSSGQKKSAPTGRRRKPQANAQGAAQDAPWKVGASETTQGQTVTGTMVGRDKSVTGNEASTCRDVTGTEYLGADIFREFCQTNPAKTPQRGSRTSTSRGNAVTGNEVGRSSKVTGNEPGTCKRVTGSEYVSAQQDEAFCGTKPAPAANRVTGSETRKGKSVTGNNVGRSGKVTGDESGAQRELTGTQYTNTTQAIEGRGAPAKVGQSKTLRGGSVSGTLVGRRERMTGDEAGSCRNVTGDDYIGQEQFTSFCKTKPEPKDRKVGVSGTGGGEEVTGSMTGRSQRVTGNEPGTCKAVTGTPYAGNEQYATYCGTSENFDARKRMDPSKRSFGKPMTGQQPSVGGSMTGDSKGACETVSGTPYVGADQAALACPAVAAEPGSPDFPQPLEGAPWDDFSVQSPSHAAQKAAHASHVTGSQYEQGQITGPFGKAGGKVTGTEEARFGKGPREPQPIAATATEIYGRIKSRITGEGQDAGPKITGDDWDRGDRVTGTEGASATQRNTTRRGAPMNAMGARAAEPAEAPQPVSKVTGSSGNTAQGSLVTYSGGARG